ncbi:hypothetical protein BG015_007697 [Linnemannia schmuckeri]|uniref:Uncharacterized protein n=1 Tax=Linnemannia schmuckeri TaxID=64567 RepID=A0A9P5S0P0_9FUNG|nr:hypothetical protein BG015_007697 [Linnemannia schmuckeri]
MTSAADLFFGIPELVAILASVMELQDLSRFILTNRFVHTHSLPLFRLARQYHSLDLRALSSQHNFSAPDEIAALLRNVHLVRNLRVDTEFFDHYYNCLASAAVSKQRQVDSTEAGELAEGAGGAGGAAAMGVQTTVDTQFVTASSATSLTEVMIPRMTKLIRFEHNPPGPDEEWNSPSLRRLGRAEPVFSKFCLMIPPAQASHLQSLTLNGMRIKHQRELNNVAQTIAGMTGLQTLRLGIERPEEVRKDVVPRIFFELPSSIQVFMIRPKDLGYQPAWLEVVEGVEATLATENVYERDGPLRKLREFDVCEDHLMDDPEPYFLMLPYCPELEQVMVPQMVDRDDEEILAHFIVTRCPKLRRLSRVDIGFDIDDDDGEESDYGNYDGVMLHLTTDAMPVNTLESFYYDGYYESHEFQRTRLMSLLSGHMRSLTQVHLRNTRNLCGFSVSQLLNFATVLESLVIDGTRENWEAPFGVPVQRLSDVSWATSRLRELRLEVNVGHLSQPPRRNGPQRPFSLPTTIVDVMILSLGSCLANIGRQKDLQVLELRVALPRHITYRNGNSWTYRDEVFPGLLTLNNRADGGPPDQGIHLRRGFLELLGGLSKLEELRGSVNVSPRDAYGYSTEREEAEWMRMHWPKLRVAEFYPAKAERPYPITKEFLWLQNELSGLIYDHSDY